MNHIQNSFFPSMNSIRRVLLVFWLFALCGTLLGGPTDALQNYFTALEKGDKALMRNTIHAPDGYKDQFVKIIDVSTRLNMLSELLNTKYNIAVKDRRSPAQYFPTLQKELLTREVKVDGDRAETIPQNAKEVPVPLVRIEGRWVLDLRRGKTDADLMMQGEELGAIYDAVIPLLNGLIYKIDTLDTTKFSHEEAWRMISIQINRQVVAVSKTKGEQNGGGKGVQDNAPRK